jgi:tetratricopeptide (TPR) repeat protein
MSRKKGSALQQNPILDHTLAAAYGHWSAGRLHPAELLCRQVLASAPDNARAVHLLGLIAYNCGRLDLALAYLRKACTSSLASAQYFGNLAEICRLNKLHSEGESAARRALALSPQFVGGWNNLGIILQETGRYDEALSCLERVVALNPDYPEAWNNIGNTYKKMGRLECAREFYGKALEKAPRYPEAHSNIANVFKELGDLDRAAAEARTAIQLSPRFADAYINAAAIEALRDRHEAALQILDAVLAFDPLNNLALQAKAGSLGKLDRHEEALAAARLAVMQAPGSGDAVNALGQALHLAGKYDEALAVYDEACQLVATIPEMPLLNKGTLLTEINRMDEAQLVFEQALAKAPNSAKAFYGLSGDKKFRPGDPMIDLMEDLLEKKQIQNHGDLTLLHFALGTAWLDAGDSARAFAHLNEGNRMKRASISYDADKIENWVEAIIAAFPAPLVERLRGHGIPSEQFVFIIGMPRSGTTLVEQVLAAHPDILGAGELPILQNIVSRQKGAFPAWVSDATPADLARLGQEYSDKAGSLIKGRKRLVDKMPANFFYAGVIALCLPRARIIHCRRDPVDTCLSCYTKLFIGEQNFSYDQAELGRFYCAYIKLMDHWRRVLPPEKFIEVDYEAMVDDMETEARRLVSFCGSAWDEACLNFYKSNRPVRTASVHQVRQPVYKTSVGRWKKFAPHLTPLLEALQISMPGTSE